MGPTRPTLAGTVAVLGLLGLLAGCGGDAAGDPDPAPAASSATSPATSPDAPAGSGTPSAEPTPSVAPASGPLLEHEGSSLRAPRGWQVTEGFLPVQIDVDGPGPQALSFFEQEAADPTATTDQLARSALKGYRGQGLRRLPDVELDGAPAYHIGGWRTDLPDSRIDRFGAVHDGRFVTVTIFLERDLGWREDPQLVESVLASFRWRD